MTRYALLDKSGKTRLTTEAGTFTGAKRQFVGARKGAPIPAEWSIVKREVKPAPKREVKPVKPTTKPMAPAFKAGDRVRVTESTRWYTAGDIGIYRGGIYNVDFSGQGNRKVAHDGRWSVPDERLELAPKKEAPKKEAPKKEAPKKEAPKKLKPGHFRMTMDSGDTLEFWLVVEGGEVSLKGARAGHASPPEEYYIYTLRPDGTSMRSANISLPGLKLNTEGEVMM